MTFISINQFPSLILCCFISNHYLFESISHKDIFVLFFRTKIIYPFLHIQCWYIIKSNLTVFFYPWCTPFSDLPKNIHCLLWWTTIIKRIFFHLFILICLLFYVINIWLWIICIFVYQFDNFLCSTRGHVILEG